MTSSEGISEILCHERETHLAGKCRGKDFCDFCIVEAEARASERSKLINDAGYVNSVVEYAKKEAYAKGKEDGIEFVTKTCDGCSRVQYQNGQKDLIGKLIRPRDVCETCFKDMKKLLASESAGRAVAIGKPDAQVKTKPEAPENAKRKKNV